MEKFCRWRGEISPQNSNNKASHPHYFFILAKLCDAIEFCILSLKIYDASELKIKGGFLNLQIPRVGDLACDGASCGDGGVC